MEFPHLGSTCEAEDCKLLDFLPFECDSCHGIFCKEHYPYAAHTCKESYLKDNQVPVCPLCGEPIPGKRGEAPDISVSEHIDRECKDDWALKKRGIVYKNRCHLKGCKQKEFISLICDSCGLNYCLKHRHPTDHKCSPGQARRQAASVAGQAAIQRASKAKKTADSNGALPSGAGVTKLRSSQANMSDEEALQRALQLSMADARVSEEGPSTGQAQDVRESEDQMLQKAIRESERHYNKNKDKCGIS